MTFKTQAEIFQALLDGKTLVHKDDGVEVNLQNGNLRAKEKADTCDWDTHAWSLFHPADWSIKKEPMVIWVNIHPEYTWGVYTSGKVAKEACTPGGRTVKFIEVEE